MIDNHPYPQRSFAGLQIIISNITLLLLLFTHTRWSGGPRVNEVEPILVIFEDRKEKEQVSVAQVSVFRKIILTNFLPTKMCLWHKGSEIQLPTLFSFDLWLWQKVYIVDQQFCTTWNKTKLEDHDIVIFVLGAVISIVSDADLKFVTTVTTGGQLNFFPAV